MFILDWLPFWIFHLIVLSGIGGLIASEVFRFIPLISTYRLPIQVIAVLLLAFGLYAEGGIATQEKWETRVKDFEAKVAIAEEQSKTANAKLEASLAEKQKVIKQTQIVYKDRIVEVAKVIDAGCTVPKEAIDILNQAAELPR